MVLAQIILFWLAISFYVAASILYVLSLKFSQKNKFIMQGRLAVIIGLIPHTIAILLRWFQTGHGPYAQLYEVAASDTWISIIVFLIICWRYKKLEQIGAIVMPVSFLLLGLGVMGSKEITTIPVTFKTYWLIVHIIFAKFAYGSALAGGGCAVFYLLKAKGYGGWLERLPGLEKLDELSYKLLAVGYIFNTIMIAAGSIWAKNAWGSYWSWDPIETWSLISWLVYGLYLHLRRTYGWKGSRACWLAIFTLAVMVFAIFGIAYIYPSIHEVYLNGKI